MGRSRSPNRDKAFEIYKQHKGCITPREIAKILNEKSSKISVWKNQDRWDEKYINKGGAPKGNLNNLKNGMHLDPTKHLEEDFLKKYIPNATKKIIVETAEAGLNTLDILWSNIQLQFAAIVRSQRIMNVTSKNEMIKELKKTKVQKELQESEETGKEELVETYREEEFEFQFAWDRQATFLTAQSKAMTTLQNMIAKYEELLHKNWDLSSLEQKLRINKLKADISEITGEGNNFDSDDGFIEALEGTAKEDWKDEE